MTQIGNRGPGADWTAGMSAEEARRALDAARADPTSPYYVPGGWTAENDAEVDRALETWKRERSSSRVGPSGLQVIPGEWRLDYADAYDFADGTVEVLVKFSRGEQSIRIRQQIGIVRREG